jgi:glycosyltransferase involved in cell wall biosynthesis
VHYYELRGRVVRRIADLSRIAEFTPAPQGAAGTAPFRVFESGMRRLQRAVKSPYFALFDSYRFYEACARILHGYDICHEHNSVLSVGAALACRRLNMPYILTVDADPMFELEMQGRPMKGLQARLANWEAHQTFQVASHITTLSEPSRRRMVERYGVPAEKITVVPLGADVDRFEERFDVKAARAQMGLGDGPVIGFVGSFQKWHAIEDLVESFAEVHKQHPDAPSAHRRRGRPVRCRTQSR